MYRFQSTHPSWGATVKYIGDHDKEFISIHAPIVGCDFNDVKGLYECVMISIHAPIVGCDRNDSTGKTCG